MAYPETNRLTRPIRTTIFLVLVASFFTISPLLVAYTIGYEYNWQTHRIEQTGVISIDIEPKDATIFLNGIPMPGVSPMRLPNRPPGNYHITIAKEGYASWDKDIVVRSKQTTYIKNITLFANHVPAQILSDIDGTVTSMDSSYDGLYLSLHVMKGDAHSMVLYDTKTKEITPLETMITASSTVDWSPFAHIFSITTPQSSGALLTIISLPTILPDRTDEYLIGANIHTQWSNSLLHSGLYMADGTHITLLARGKRTAIGTIPDADWPWLVDNSAKLWWYNPTTFQLVPNDAPANTTAITTDEPITTIVDINSSRAIVQNDHVTQVILLKPQKETSTIPVTMTIPTSQNRYNPSTEEWLTWSPWELWSMYNDGHTVLLNRRSERITQVIPLDKFGVELLTTPTSLAAFNPGYYTNQTLWQGGTIEHVAVNQKLKQIFFLGSIGNVNGVFEMGY